MKKFFSFVLMAVICFGLLLPAASAAGDVIIFDSEIQAIKVLMENRDMDVDGLKAEVLYDQNDMPSFLLGYTENHYMIMSRNLYKCLECGEGNPYQGTDNSSRKYYGGLLQYYVGADKGFQNLVSNMTEEEIKTTDYISEDVLTRTISANTRQANLLATVEPPKYLPYYSTRLTNKAFGYNDDNTCTAVAVSLVLNYLDITYNDGIVPDSLELENLSEDVPFDASSSYVKNTYPYAYALHRTLVNDCNLHPVSYADAVINAVNAFSNKYMSNVRVSVIWNLSEIPNNYVLYSIDNNMPSMVTYTFFGDYQFHSMPVYGYRLLSDGSKEYLVHTGWYSTIRNNASNKQRMPLVWASEEAFTYLYKFSIET